MDRGVMLALALACATPQEAGAPSASVPACQNPARPRGEDWRRIASDPDRTRLRGWREAWRTAIGADVQGDAALFSPDRALDDPLPPFGNYRCRIHHLGGTVRVAPAWAGCRVEEDKGRSRFVVEDSAQRASGLFYPDSSSRAVFLGTLTIGDEARPLRYGRDRLRDLAGFVERIDERRWRIALPQPSFGGTLDLIELVPG